MTKTIFNVRGPFEVPCFQGKAGRTITIENAKDFWNKNSSLVKLRGCYVFGIRAAKGMKPWYVGKATKSFKQEAFAYHKITLYQQLLADCCKGTPILFFLTVPSRRGRINVLHIGELERFLIDICVAANPNLLNKRGTKAAGWAIAGVLFSNKGKPSASAKQFKKLTKI